MSPNGSWAMWENAGAIGGLCARCSDEQVHP
jgi:hypothetical protein